jgi:GntR family transcriptional regulator
MILLDYKDRRPIYEQIVEKLSDLMVRGVLLENTPLPSVRSMAADLSINPNTVQRAYIELERQGYIYSLKGKGSFVAGMDQITRQKQADLLAAFDAVVEKASAAGIAEDALLNEVRKLYSADSQQAASARTGSYSNGGNADDRIC